LQKANGYFVLSIKILAIAPIEILAHFLQGTSMEILIVASAAIVMFIGVLAYGFSAAIRKVKALFCARTIKKAAVSYSIYRN
jgi:hypothetical protein